MTMGAMMRLGVMGVVLAAPAVIAPRPMSAAVVAAALPRCGAGVLRAEIVDQEGGAGNIYTTLALRNVGRGSCVTRGYPGVSLVDARGRQIGRPATRVARPGPLIVLRPGGAASTVVHTLNPGVGTTDCLPPSFFLRVYPPDAYTSLLVRARLSECLEHLEVRSLTAGTSGM